MSSHLDPQYSRYLWPVDREIAAVTGWGMTDIHNESLAVHLQAVSVPIVDREECRSLLGGLTKNMLCAGYEEGKGVCNYDSGGPLVVAGKLVGVVNFPTGCAVAAKPAVYVNVAVLRDFIVLNAGVE